MKNATRPSLAFPAPFRLLGVAAVFVASLRAQAPAAPNDVDRAWDTLRTTVEIGTPTGAMAVRDSAARATEAAAYVAQANQVRDFYVRYPGHSGVAEARRLEALLLSQAALRGDSAQDGRLAALVNTVRVDNSIPALRRFEAVAWSKQVTLARQRLTARPAVLGAHELIAKALVAEFPSVDVAFESWLAVARDSAPADAWRICTEIASSLAPARIKSGAQVIVARTRLIGRPLRDVLGATQAAALLTASDGKPVVIYSWSSQAPSSVSAITRNAPKLAVAGLVGICLDADTVAGRAAAANAPLPGTQYFNAGGAASPLAEALLFTEPGMTYIADRQGIIRDIHGRSELVAKLARYSR